jgi:AcrR family transcriptional regulator
VSHRQTPLVPYDGDVPGPSHQTTDGHRHRVRDVIIEATGALVAEDGLLAVTMSGIAERSGIGRATLYRYFSDVEAVLVAWHERQIAAHLAELTETRDRAEPHRRLAAVLESYARLSRRNHDQDLAAFLHREGPHHHAQDHVHAVLRELISDGAESGFVRGDVTPDELSTFCMHALGAAGDLHSKAAIRRLVGLTLDALRPNG